MQGRALLAIGILIYQLAGATLAADDLAGGLTKLFDAGATVSPKSLEAARAQQNKLRRLPDFDARAKYAFALVLIQQRQLEDARRGLAEVLEDRPDMLPAWQAKIWADLTGRSYAAALTDMRAAAAAMDPVDPDASSAITEQRQLLARTLGRGIGFLIATPETKIPPRQLALDREEILAKMGIDRAAFLIGQQTMINDIADLDSKLAAARDAGGAAVARQEEEQADQKRGVSKATAEVDYQILKNQAETAGQLKSSDWEIEQLERQLAKTQYEQNTVAMALVRQQIELQANIQVLAQAENNVAAGGASNQAAMSRNAQAIPFMNTMIRRFSEQYAVLGRQVAAVQAQLATVRAQREGLVDDNAMVTTDLEAKSRELKHKEKKIDYVRKQVARPAGAGRALVKRKRAFSSFEPFPFEEEKERVLAWFEK